MLILLKLNGQSLTLLDVSTIGNTAILQSKKKGAKKQEAYKVPLYPKMSSFIFSKIRTRFQIFIAKICRTQIKGQPKTKSTLTWRL